MSMYAEGIVDAGDRKRGYWRTCQVCGCDEVAEGALTGEFRCVSGYCTNDVACDECGMIDCDKPTAKTWTLEAIAQACERRGLLWGPVVDKYRKEHGIDAFWELTEEDLGEIHLRLVLGDEAYERFRDRREKHDE